MNHSIEQNSEVAALIGHTLAQAFKSCWSERNWSARWRHASTGNWASIEVPGTRRNVVHQIRRYTSYGPRHQFTD
jgi:hypothetical protein